MFFLQIKQKDNSVPAFIQRLYWWHNCGPSSGLGGDRNKGPGFVNAMFLPPLPYLKYF